MTWTTLTPERFAEHYGDRRFDLAHRQMQGQPLSAAEEAELALLNDWLEAKLPRTHERLPADVRGLVADILGRRRDGLRVGDDKASSYVEAAQLRKLALFGITDALESDVEAEPAPPGEGGFDRAYATLKLKDGRRYVLEVKSEKLT